MFLIPHSLQGLHFLTHAQDENDFLLRCIDGEIKCQ